MVPRSRLLPINIRRPISGMPSPTLPHTCPLTLPSRNGRYRSIYHVSSSGSVSGQIIVNVHYYEDGNVSLDTSKPVTVDSSSGNNPANIVRALAAAERAQQAETAAGFSSLAEGAFKSLRRQLPITRQRVDWDKVGGYRLGQDIGGRR